MRKKAIQQALWRPVVGWENRYEVSSAGEVRNAMVGTRYFGKPRKSYKNTRGYMVVGFAKTINGEKIEFKTTLSRIVALAFLPKEEGKTEVNHIDGNKKNNHVENLEWVTQRENYRHAVKHYLYPSIKQSKYFPNIAQYSLDGKFIKEYERASDAAREHNLNVETIRGCAFLNKGMNISECVARKGSIWVYSRKKPPNKGV